MFINLCSILSSWLSQATSCVPSAASVSFVAERQVSKSSLDPSQAACESVKTCRDPCKSFASLPKLSVEDASLLQIRQPVLVHLQATCILRQRISTSSQATCETRVAVFCARKAFAGYRRRATALFIVMWVNTHDNLSLNLTTKLAFFLSIRAS